MLWFAKQAKSKGAADSDAIEPASLPVEFDRAIAETKLNTLLEAMKERGGPQPFVDALRLKHELFVKALPPEGPVELTRSVFTTLIECVFPARRKLAEFISGLSDETLHDAVNGLVYGDEPIAERIQAFCELVPKEQKKSRRAIWDLAAEILHFRAPERIPLMTRWVWDTNTETGALRELIRGSDLMETVPLDTRPETFEAARSWIAELLAEGGFYRDMPFMVDLLLAQAYSEYVKAMSGRVGLIDAEFGAQHDPLELPMKLLGIDARAKDVIAARADGQGQTLH